MTRLLSFHLILVRSYIIIFPLPSFPSLFLRETLIFNFHRSSLSLAFVFFLYVGIIYIAFGCLVVCVYININKCECASVFSTLHSHHQARFFHDIFSYFCGKCAIICAMNSVCYSVHLNVAACFTTICFMHFKMRAQLHSSDSCFFFFFFFVLPFLFRYSFALLLLPFIYFILFNTFHSLRILRLLPMLWLLLPFFLHRFLSIFSSTTSTSLLWLSVLHSTQLFAENAKRIFFFSQHYSIAIFIL